LRKALKKHSATTRLGDMIRDLLQRIDSQTVDAWQLTNVITEDHALENMNLTSLVSIYSLCLWCLDGKKAGNGYGFPFDRPLLSFARRIIELNNKLSFMQDQVSSVMN
jgi:hypothetical protein